RRTARCLVMCESLRRFCVEGGRVPPDRIERGPPGIDGEEVSAARGPAPAEARRGLGVPANAGRVVGTVTRLFEQKGNEFLVEAAKTVLERWPDAFFVVAGDGPLRPHLEDEARRLRVADRVRFLGFRSDVAVVLRAL